jgi:hypothetical protein
MSIDSHVRCPTTVHSLNRQYHVVMCPSLQTRHFPSIEVFSNSHNALTSFILPHTEDLSEGGRSLDTRFVHSHLSPDKIEASITSQVTFLFALGWRGGFVIWVEILDYVEFYEWVCGPAIYGEVGVPIWFVGASKVDDSAHVLMNFFRKIQNVCGNLLACSARVPTLPTDKVTSAIPSHTVLPSWPVCIRHFRLVVCPV